MKNILTIGFYNKDNIGDELFKQSLKHLFPSYNFKFTFDARQDDLEWCNAIFIGGGSLLEKDINRLCLNDIKQKPIFYIGVGAETNISPMHMELLRIAKIVAIRSPEQIDKIKLLNNNTIIIPDLVYSLKNNIKKSNVIKNSVLFVSNSEVLPNNSSEYWKHSSFDYFKSEMSQFLDWLVLNKYTLNFFHMCHNKSLSDSWTSSQLASMMKHRSTNYELSERPSNFEDLTYIFSKYETIITQRYHGIILSELLNTPYISIHHHDKLKFANPMRGESVSYYGLNKQLLIDSFLKCKKSNFIPIESNIFEQLVSKINEILNKND